MDRSTILKPTGCNLTRLPLGAREGFLLSQLDGQLTLEEIAVVCSMDLAEAERIAARLVELGAACRRQTQAPQREKRGRRAPRAAVEEVARSGRDPRSEDVSLLPPPPPKKTTPPAGNVPERRRSRGSLRMQRASSRRVKAAKTPPPAPPPVRARTERPPQANAKKNTLAPAANRPSKRPSKTSTAAVTMVKARGEIDRVRKLQAAAREIEIQARVEPLLAAAEAALKTNDVITAANNLRLALEHREDPVVRLKLEEVDRLAKAVRLERSLACARAAEERERWGDAAVHLTRAHETKPTADIADRAANAILRSDGDLARAAALAEQAVSLDPKNPRYRMTLAEVYLAADALTRAAKHAAVALELAPRDPRAKRLADAIAKAPRENG